MNFAEEVAGFIGGELTQHRLYEDETSLYASHITSTVWSESVGTSVVAQVFGFAADGDTRIPLGRVRVAVTYEPDARTGDTP